MTTHIGKIGRLPKGIRDELGRRMEDGEPGKDLVAWLNGSPEAREVLKAQFGGREISEQNLSDWRQSGHQEWLRAEEDRRLAASLAEHSYGLDDELPMLADHIAAITAVELARLVRQLMDQESDPEKRWARLCEVNRELSRLRRDDHRAAHAGIAQEKWHLDLEEKHLEWRKAETKERNTARIWEKYLGTSGTPPLVDGPSARGQKAGLGVSEGAKNKANPA